MSYDIDIGGESFNYTFNVSALFYDHIPAVRDRGGLIELDGLTGRQAIPILAGAFEKISHTMGETWESGVVGEPKFCAKYDAKNGWGSTVGAIIFLANIIAACALNPRHKIRVGI